MLDGAGVRDQPQSLILANVPQSRGLMLANFQRGQEYR